MSTEGNLVIQENESVILDNNPFVESVDGNLVIMTFEFHQILYERWKENPAESTITETLKSQGLDPDILGHAYAGAIAWDFKAYGDPAACPEGENHERHSARRRNDVALLSSGVFYVTMRGFQWNRKLRKKLWSGYPEMTIEDGLIQAGINPARVGYARIKP